MDEKESKQILNLCAKDYMVVVNDNPGIYDPSNGMLGPCGKKECGEHLMGIIALWYTKNKLTPGKKEDLITYVEICNEIMKTGMTLSDWAMQTKIELGLVVDNRTELQKNIDNSVVTKSKNRKTTKHVDKGFNRLLKNSLITIVTIMTLILVIRIGLSFVPEPTEEEPVDLAHIPVGAQVTEQMKLNNCEEAKKIYNSKYSLGKIYNNIPYDDEVAVRVLQDRMRAKKYLEQQIAENCDDLSGAWQTINNVAGEAFDKIYYGE